MLPEKRLLSRRKFLSFLPIVPMAVIPKDDIQKPNSYNPKFKIGDCVEYRVVLEEDPSWYERGDIIQVSLESNGDWSYKFIIRDCPSPEFLGVEGVGYEEELTLVTGANWGVR